MGLGFECWVQIWVRRVLWEEKACLGVNRAESGGFGRGFLCKRKHGWVLFGVSRFGILEVVRWGNRGKRLWEVGFWYI